MPLHLELTVEEHHRDRVIVVVRLAPDGTEGTTRVDGVSVQLCTCRDECLGPKLLLPIQGELTGPVVTTAEIRVSDAEIPIGSVLVGRAWTGDTVTEVSCPTDPWTELEGHLRGSRALAEFRVPPCAPEKLSAGERDKLARLFPWIRNWTQVRGPQQEEEEEENLLTVEENLDAFAADLGLDAETTEWLRDLLDDEEEDDEELGFDV